MPRKSSVTPSSVDISMLKKGSLYSTAVDKRITWVFIGLMLFLIASVCIASIVGPQAGPDPYTIQSNTPAPRSVTADSLFNLIFDLAFLMAAGYLVAWKMFFRDLPYNQRRDQFGETNHLESLTFQELAAYIPTALLREGAHNEQLVGYRIVSEGVTATVFDYSYTLGDDRYQKDYQYGVTALVFNKSYPHLYLDSHENGLSDVYAGSQKVQLEGNFSEYFDLYMPEGSQSGALTIFSPDVMQTILDVSRPFDIEVDGNQVSILTSGYAFTQESLSTMLFCASQLSSEFKQLNRSWQPIYTIDQKGYTLKTQKVWARYGLVIAVMVLLYFVVEISTALSLRH